MSTLPNEKLYDRDFYGWTLEQAALLRSGQFSIADIENIIEEIESMGRSETSQLVNRLAVLLQHLLKWQFQSRLQSSSWRYTIEDQRRRITKHIRKNPSLKSELQEAINDAYGDAIFDAERETGIHRKNFPQVCPYTFTQMMSDDFWPEGD